MAKCGNCGANVKKKTAFCPSCGTKVEQIEGNNQPTKGMTLPLVIAFVVIALVVGFGGGFLIAGSNSEKTSVEEVDSDKMQETQNTEKDITENESVIVPENETEIAEKEPVKEEPETEEPEVKVPDKKEPVDVTEVYNYVSIGEEVRTKESALYEVCPNMYSYAFYHDNIEGMYEGEDELTRKLNYSAFHFSKSQPRDIRWIEWRFDGDYIGFGNWSKYNDDLTEHEQSKTIPSDCFSMEYGNVLTLSKDYLATLEEGVYEFMIFLDGDHPFGCHSTIIIHDDIGEEVKNYRADFDVATSFYSTESKNDILFYMNGATSPIKALFIGDEKLDYTCYDLVYDGYGIVFHPEFLEQYTDKTFVNVLVVTESLMKIELKIVFLNHVEK